MPVHEALVRGLFAYDLVGFQTENDRQAFTDYVEREAEGWTTGNGRLHAYGRRVSVGSFPISIDTRAVAARAARAAGTGVGVRLRNSLAERRLVIGVDRLDYTKGLVRRFAAVERLFETRPQHRRATVVMQIASPTREDIPEYQQIRAELDGCIGRINGRFGEPDHFPVRYINRHFRQETLFGFFRASRVAMVTPLRDGMNLVAKEFVASQDPEDPGVVVLSRFAGAARERDAALIVNPFNVDEVADALDRALVMPPSGRPPSYPIVGVLIFGCAVAAVPRRHCGILGGAETGNARRPQLRLGDWAAFLLGAYRAKPRVGAQQRLILRTFAHVLFRRCRTCPVARGELRAIGDELDRRGWLLRASGRGNRDRRQTDRRQSKTGQRYPCHDGCLLADRTNGLSTQGSDEGFRAGRPVGIQALAAADGPLPLCPDRPGERLVGCRNPALAAERARKRDEPPTPPSAICGASRSACAAPAIVLTYEANGARSRPANW